MQTGQTLGERVRMLEAGGAVKDAEITRLHAEVARLREAQEIADRRHAADLGSLRIVGEENRRLRAVIASPNGHHPDCGYQLDQYSWECTCERSSVKANCSAE